MSFLGASARPASSPNAPIRVLLADDHAVTLWGLRMLVESMHARMVVAGTASSCTELLNHPALGKTDIVLLDLGLGDSNSLECVPLLVATAGVKVVVLTGDLHVGHHRDAVMKGARGVVLKSQPTDAILHAIERVHAGEVCLDGALMSLLLGALPGATAAPVAEDKARRVDTLTPKERQVVQAVVEHGGSKSLVIAESLGMSDHTLRNHLTVIYSKLAVQGKLGLYAYALDHGLAHAPARRERRAGPRDASSSAAHGRVA